MLLTDFGGLDEVLRNLWLSRNICQFKSVCMGLELKKHYEKINNSIRGFLWLFRLEIVEQVKVMVFVMSIFLQVVQTGLGLKLL